MTSPVFQALNTYNAARTVVGGDVAARPAIAADEQSNSASFAVVHALAEAVAKGEQASSAYLAGNADPHSVVEALARAELAVDTAVVIRDKIVEAYQELLRMPV